MHRSPQYTAHRGSVRRYIRSRVVEHPFSDIDSQPDPSAWLECLDTTRQEPFHQRYKQLLLEMLRVRPGGRYLDVGCGTGDDARALGDRGASAVGIDLARTMTAESRRRGLSMVVQGDAAALPFESSTFDGTWADQTFQHLADPHLALTELIRVVRPGARVAVADPDYSTQSMNFPDRELARQVFQFRAFHALRNGTLAHTMDAEFRKAGLVDVESRKERLDVRDPRTVDHVMGLRSWASAAGKRGLMSSAQVKLWEQLYDEMAASTRFRWSVSFYLTAGSKR